MATKKNKAPSERVVYVVYLGRGSNTSARYAVFLQDGKRLDNVSFSRKLQRFHRIGAAYPARMIGESQFITSKIGYEITDFKSGISAKEISEFVQIDAKVDERIKRGREQSKLTKIARDAAKSIKAIYKRASYHDQIAFVRSLVEELESD